MSAPHAPALPDLVAIDADTIQPGDSILIEGHLVPVTAVRPCRRRNGIYALRLVMPGHLAPNHDGNLPTRRRGQQCPDITHTVDADEVMCGVRLAGALF